jgi:FSR family fosmidomycin resistance protein-like MFS transporter
LHGARGGAVLVLLAIELLDELVGGSRAAAWPLIRHDLHLSYPEIGLVLALPGLFGSALDPLIGLAGDTRRRGALMLAGGLFFALSAALSAVAIGFWSLLVALLIGNPATGAFVSLAQATLMDRDPAERERNMARWTVAGSVGYVVGPALIAAGVALGFGWRGVLVGLAVAAVPLALAVRSVPQLPAAEARPSAGSFMRAFRNREVLRWLALLEATDLLGDVFHGFLALYFVDVAGTGAVEAALAVAVWTAAAFIGDLALLPLLRRVSGRAYLRGSALAALAVYPLFLLAPSTLTKLLLLAALGLLNSGWYAIPKAGLYSALPGRSGTAVAVAGIGGLAGAVVPAALGFLAGSVGLAATMWLLLIAPLALLVLTPRRPAERPPDPGHARPVA